MTITVQIEGGPELHFPDDADQNAIRSAVARYTTPSPSTMGYGTGLARQAALGVPIAGAAVNPLEAATSAAIKTGPGVAARALLSRRGLPSWAAANQRPIDPATAAESEDYFQKYAEDLEQEKAKDDRFAAENPKASTAAQIAGGLAGTLPLAATGAGATLLGLGGRTIAGQMARGAASGAGISAADAALRGGSPGTAAAVGGGVGAALPMVGAALSPLTNRIMQGARAMLNPQEEAVLQTSRVIDRGQAQGGRGTMSPTDMQTAQTQGMPAANIDIGGEPGRDLARWAADSSPEARDTLTQFTGDRYRGQGQRFADHFDSTLNFPSEKLRNDAIRDVRDNVYQPRYAQAYKSSAQVPLWPDAQLMRGRSAAERAAMENLQELAQAPEVQSAIRTAVPQLRNWAVRDRLRPPTNPFVVEMGPNGVPRTVLQPDVGKASQPFPSLQLWDYIKRALDGMETPTARQFSRSLRENLDTLVPDYATARAAAQPTRFFNGASDAYEAGRNFINQGQNFNHPDVQSALQRMTPTERALFQDGYTREMTDAVRRTPDRLNVINRINQSDAARTEVQTALGPQRYAALEARIRLEDLMDRARQAVTGNSKTNQYMQAMLAYGIGGAATTSAAGLLTGSPPSTNDVIYGALMAGAKRGQIALNARVAQRVATLLTSGNPGQLRLGMQQLTNNPSLMQALRSAGTILAGAQAGRLQ